MGETSSSQTISTRMQQIAELAKQAPEMAFTTLAHHLDIEWLREAYRRTRKGGALGVDGQSADDYAKNLETNLQSLLDRAKSGTYRAPPVRRVHIPKGSRGSETRPIGIPTFEDKVLQRAVSMVLEAIYEQDFYSLSYGFRPGKSAHQALEALRQGTMEMRGGWILEVDVRKFFDSVDHDHLRAVLHRRVRDGVLLKLIGKWLKAGVLEGKGLTYPESGTPQGGVASPVLANIFLHEVVDQWFVKDVQPRLEGRALLVRYADDMVFVFEREEDARRVYDVLPKRFSRYGLTLHPDKTRLVQFLRPPFVVGRDDNEAPGSFSFLGFTHYWGRARSGFWVVKKRTDRTRLSRALHRIREWCRTHRHESLRTQQRHLALVMRGHYGYYGVTSNFGALQRFYRAVDVTWRRWLSRRSQRGAISWVRWNALRKVFVLPLPRIANRYAT